MAEKEKAKEFPGVEEFNTVDGNEEKCLILHNDEVHTFDYVIECLIEICEHTTEQAEQCTYLVHYKGKCDVKSGSFEILRPMRHGLIDKGLNATIE
jgi:ATP-dependent Clp protease adaptor protein ClpS